MWANYHPIFSSHGTSMWNAAMAPSQSSHSLQIAKAESSQSNIGSGIKRMYWRESGKSESETTDNSVFFGAEWDWSSQKTIPDEMITIQAGYGLIDCPICKVSSWCTSRQGTANWHWNRGRRQCETEKRLPGWLTQNITKQICNSWQSRKNIEDC